MHPAATVDPRRLTPEEQYELAVRLSMDNTAPQQPTRCAAFPAPSAPDVSTVESLVGQADLQLPKGLNNEANQYHCFINVCLQAVMHLTALKNAIKQTGHDCIGEDACLFCEVIYRTHQAHKSSRRVIDPVKVRERLHTLSPNSIRDGEMGDATEVFAVILQELLLRAHKGEKPPIHRMFSPGCPTSNLLIASDFIGKVQQSKERSFVDVLNASLSCKETLPYIPTYIVIQVVWGMYDSKEKEACLRGDITDLVKSLGQEFALGDVFPRAAETALKARMAGFFTYYTGQHYTCYFYVESLGQWVHFDDKEVKKRGSYEDVCQHMIQGKHQPVLIFYEVEGVDHTAQMEEERRRETIEKEMRDQGFTIDGSLVLVSSTVAEDHP